jgi:hypothetical protein
LSLTALPLLNPPWKNTPLPNRASIETSNPFQCWY